MKKILILNLLAAAFLAGAAEACQPPDALGELRQASGQPGDCMPDSGGNVGDWLPMPEFPMPALPAQPQPEIMPCYGYLDGDCEPGIPFPSFPGADYCDENGEMICLDLAGGKVCFPACYVSAPLYTGSIVYENFASAGVPAELGRAYLGQSKAKALVAERLFKNNAGAKAGLKSDKRVKVMSDGKIVSLILGNRLVKINDTQLAAKVQKLVMPSSGGQFQPENKILFYAGAAIAIECMTDDGCWGAVGDAVSDVSEWLNS